MHAKRGDKTIVFSDDIFALRTLATKLKMCVQLISEDRLTDRYIALSQVVY